MTNEACERKASRETAKAALDVMRRAVATPGRYEPKEDVA